MLQPNGQAVSVMKQSSFICRIKSHRTYWDDENLKFGPAKGLVWRKARGFHCVRGVLSQSERGRQMSEELSGTRSGDSTV